MFVITTAHVSIHTSISTFLLVNVPPWIYGSILHGSQFVNSWHRVHHRKNNHFGLQFLILDMSAMNKDIKTRALPTQK